MVPEQLPPEGLLATIVFLSETVPPLLDRLPPAIWALLPERVELLTVAVPDAAFHMPPPPPAAISVKALLPERVELFTVSVPLLNMPPPKLILPLATVRLFRVSFASTNRTSNTRTAL